MKPAQTMSLSVMCAIALAGLASLRAAAQDSGWYIGANAGEARAKLDEERIMSGLLGAGFTTTGFTEDEKHFGYKAFTGYQFNRYIALEGGYFDLGKFSFDATTFPVGTLHGEIKIKGVNLDAVGLIPFTEKFSALLRLGAIYGDARDTFSGTGAVDVRDPDRRARTGNYKFGAGLQYSFVDALSMRLEAERYRIDDAVGNDGDVDLFSLGMVYRFGHAAAPAFAEESIGAALSFL